MWSWLPTAARWHTWSPDEVRKQVGYAGNGRLRTRTGRTRPSGPRVARDRGGTQAQFRHPDAVALGDHT